MTSALVFPLLDIGRLPLHKRHRPLHPTILRVRDVLAIRRHATRPRRQPHPLAELALAGDGMPHRRRPRVHPVVLDDAVRTNIGGKLCDARDDEAEEDDADELEDEEEAAAGVGLRGEIAEADCQDGLRGVRRWERGEGGGTHHIGVVQRVGVVEAFDGAEDGGAPGEPEEKGGRLQDEGALGVVEVELLGVVAAEVADEVDGEDAAADEVEAGGQHGVPETLGICLDWGCRGDVDVHHGDDDDELVEVVSDCQDSVQGVC